MDLVLNTSQKLLISQKMLLSTEILQMSTLELIEYIKEISVENPVVDYEEPDNKNEKFDVMRKKMDYLDSSDEQNKIYYCEEKEDEGNNDDWLFRGSTSETLEDHLMEQLNVLKQPKDIFCAARYIIRSLDLNGYLNETVQDIAKTLNTKEDTVKKALSLVQSFEPTGVAANDLIECLLLQLKKLPCENKAAEKIIENCLEMVGRNQLHLISKKLKLSQSEVSEAVKLIKSLNPKPGNSFDTGKSLEYIVPDAVINKVENEYQIILNDKFFPNIRINSYYKMFLDGSYDGKTKEYIYNKIKQAEWIITCINKRNTTLTKTLEAIVSIQRDFFDLGSSHIKPMRLNDVAVEIGMHESTVSRTIKQKYLQCRHGVYPLCYFFQSNVSSSNSTSITPEKVKLLIKDIIEKEDPCSPFSDREITEKLTEMGVEISRRTVAKYREAAGILGTSGRKNT